MAAPAGWRSSAWRSFPRACWEDETFMYHPATGETHVLNRSAARVLEALAAGPLSTAELAGQLDLDPGDSIGAALQAQLTMLASVRLIEAV